MTTNRILSYYPDAPQEAEHAHHFDCECQICNPRCPWCGCPCELTLCTACGCEQDLPEINLDKISWGDELELFRDDCGDEG